ncbi:MAG: hypothetical protein AAF639_12560, partial [Chloroflexota bacterium]
LLVRLYNHLFYEQERVMPVYITFATFLEQKGPPTTIEIGEHYLSCYLRCYLAFQYRRPELLSIKPEISEIEKVAREFDDIIVNDLLDTYHRLTKAKPDGDSTARFVVDVPRTVAELHGIISAVIIDEFQVLTDVYDKSREISLDVTNFCQWAVDSPIAPMLVSGSAVSLLITKALRGALTGRFNYWYLPPLARDDVHDLAFRLGAMMRMEMTIEFADMLWKVTAGYPNSIENLMRSQCPARRRYPSLDALEEVLIFEVSNRLANTWQHYSSEFVEHVDLLNGDGLAKKVMLWVTKYPEPPIDAAQIAKEFDVTYAEAQDALLKLYQADIIDVVSWERYEGPGDPMLRRYIEYNFRWQLEQISLEKAVQTLRDDYGKLRGDLNNALGEIGELYAALIMRSFDKREVDGETYFKAPHPVFLPKFDTLEKRGGTVVAGDKVEIDVIGEWQQVSDKSGQPQRCAWLVEAKNWSKPIPLSEVEHFFKQAGQMKEKQGYDQVTLWYFSKSGFTEPAVNALEKAGVLYSDWKHFFALARHFDLFGLPNR